MPPPRLFPPESEQPPLEKAKINVKVVSKKIDLQGEWQPE